MNNSPLVSVILPVWNGEAFVKKAVSSIINQSYTNFELLILDDGSTDRTCEFIKQEFNDPRVILRRLPHRGIVATLNEGLQASSGEYVARMDVDDVSLARRFEKQVDYLQQHPECGIVGTTYFIMDGNSLITSIYPSLLEDADIQSQLFYTNPLGHGTVMIRKSILLEHDLNYRQEALHYEDLDLWLRCSRVTTIANISEPLYVWMNHPSSLMGQHGNELDKKTHQAIHRSIPIKEQLAFIKKHLAHFLGNNYQVSENWENGGHVYQVRRRAEYQYHLYRLAWILLHNQAISQGCLLLSRSFFLRPQTYIEQLWKRMIGPKQQHA